MSDADAIREYRLWLKRIEESPTDKSIRLIFADWLEERGLDDEAQEQRNHDAARAESEQWLRAYAARMNAYEDAETAFATLLNGLRARELFAHGSDLHGLYDLDDADELKRHAEIYFGGPFHIDWNDFTFHCSC